MTVTRQGRSRELYKCTEFVKYEKLHLNASFLALVLRLSARRALLLFHERDLAEMKPTDVIAPFLSSIEFASARQTFAALRINADKIIILRSFHTNIIINKIIKS